MHGIFEFVSLNCSSECIIVIFGFWMALVFEAENCDSYFNQKEGFDNCIGDY